ncbi:Rrf2 family transcriptional regulator [Kiloniella sp. b19]|uniref:Rrf2 family transcriptional regulator n=1 Tax=Kiloniella sp. GXU_MW_B19 TaxID=3141326 RepID=UPI0031D2FF7E
MKLSTKGRYAVMAMIDLALYAQDNPVALSDIADRQEISLSYLEQLFAKLRRAGLIRSVRGPGGGYMMARPADEVVITHIFKAVEEPIRTNACNPDSPHGCRADKSRCITHDLWLGLSNTIYDYLDSVTLDDVLKRRVPISTYQPAAQ